MKLTYDQLINEAVNFAEMSMEVNSDTVSDYVQSGIAYALIAIAQELHRMNEHKANEIERRLDLSEARVERLANLAG